MSGEASRNLVDGGARGEGEAGERSPCLAEDEGAGAGVVDQ